MNKEDRKELKKLKRLMNIKPPERVLDFSGDISGAAAAFIRARLNEKSMAEQILPSKAVTGNP